MQGNSFSPSTTIITQIHSLKLTWHLKIDPWKRRFLLETIVFRCYVSFREGTQDVLEKKRLNPLKTNSKIDQPEKWLKDDPFLFGYDLFSGALAVGFTETLHFLMEKHPQSGEVEVRNPLRRKKPTPGDILVASSGKKSAPKFLTLDQ